MSHRQPLVAALLGAACLLVGCQTAPAGTAPQPAAAPVTVAVTAGSFVSAAEGPARITLNPTYATGGVRKLLADVEELDAGDIDHLRVTLYKIVEGAEVEKGDTEVPQAALQTPITFGNLAHDTTYRVRAEAFSGSDETTTKISVDADSAVDFEVARNNELASKNLKVQLVPVTFSGTATSSGLTVNGGQLEHTGSETVTLNAN